MNNPNNAYVLADCLSSMADTLATDADRLRETAGMVRMLTENGDDFHGRPVVSIVTDLVMRVFNTSNLVGSATTAIYAAHQIEVA